MDIQRKYSFKKSLMLVTAAVLLCFLIKPASSEKGAATSLILTEQQDDSVNGGSDGSEGPSAEGAVIDGLATLQDVEEFIPTTEWQKIKPGQSIPKGLHVRINFETGIKEAKLLDPNHQAENEETIEARVSHIPGTKSGIDLEEALKKIVTSRDEPTFNKQDVTEQLKALHDQYEDLRTVDEIQESLRKNKFKVTLESETVGEIAEKIRNITISPHSLKAEAELVFYLEDLQYYLHQIDNAVYFDNIGGVELLISIINTLQYSSETRGVCIVTLGATVSSNEVVTLSAVRRGVFSSLISILTDTDSDNTIRSRSLYLISTLIRADHEGSALRKLLAYTDGLKLFNSIVKSYTATNKECVKIYTMMHDILASDIHRAILMNGTSTESRDSLCLSSFDILLNKNISLDQAEKIVEFIQVCMKSSFCQRKPNMIHRLLEFHSQLKSTPDSDKIEYHQTILDFTLTTINLLRTNEKEEL